MFCFIAGLPITSQSSTNNGEITKFIKRDENVKPGETVVTDPCPVQEYHEACVIFQWAANVLLHVPLSLTIFDGWQLQHVVCLTGNPPSSLPPHPRDEGIYFTHYLMILLRNTSSSVAGWLFLPRVGGKERS